jgi:N4-gp56 family major capsid protein
MPVFNPTGNTELNSIEEAFNRLAYFALRPELYFDQVASVKPAEQAMPGNIVTFTIYTDLAPAITPLGEYADVDMQLFSDSHVQVPIAEYGNVVGTTAVARALSFLDPDNDAANLIGFNAGVSVDTLARDAIAAGTNVFYASGGVTLPTSRGTVQTEDTLVGRDIAKATAQLRTANVPPLLGADGSAAEGYYVGFIHPNVSYDLRIATGAGNWREPRSYSDPGGIYRGEVGAHEGVRFVETPRAKIWTGSGSGSINVYATHICGFQALAKAYAMKDGYGEQPRFVIMPPTDNLGRFNKVGWKHFVGYKVFREASVRRIESSSSLG